MVQWASCRLLWLLHGAVGILPTVGRSFNLAVLIRDHRPIRDSGGYTCGVRSTSTVRPGDLLSVKNPSDLPWAPAAASNNLPHLEKAGCTYFVTFCVAGARRRNWSTPGSEDPSAVAASSEPTFGTPSVRLVGNVADIVETALLHGHGSSHFIHAWVVMPDHVHAILSPQHEVPLQRILHSWKSFTANRINAFLQRRGRVWESDRFDHVVRSNEHLTRFVDYVEENPVTAGLCGQPEDWPHSSARCRCTRRWVE
jgi:REP element-mobilizing transposase RayT